MFLEFITNHPTAYQLIIIPFLIFLARITDVSLGTLRIIFISRGFKHWAPVISFAEIIIWLLAITQIMQNLNKPIYYIAYASGFAVGTYVGMWFENKLAMGAAIIRVIAEDVGCALLDQLKHAGYGLTCIEGKGTINNVKILFMIAKRKDIKPILKIIQTHNPKAVYTIEDVRSVNAANFPSLPSHPKTEHKLFRFHRKSK